MVAAALGPLARAPENKRAANGQVLVDEPIDAPVWSDRRKDER